MPYGRCSSYIGRSCLPECAKAAQTDHHNAPAPDSDEAAAAARKAGRRGLQQQLRRHQERQQTPEQATEAEETKHRNISWIRLPHIHIPSLRRQKTPVPELPPVPVSMPLHVLCCQTLTPNSMPSSGSLCLAET